MVYDGDCNFCKFWIHRWQRSTGDKVDYVPFQDPRVAEQFPELPRALFERAVQLIEPDGSVFSGAEAVFRSLAHNPLRETVRHWYEESPAFAGVSEFAYAFVATHRELFSWLTRLAWGRHLEPSTHQLVRWTFLRALAVIYVIAFVSLWVQIAGLVGSRGILPAKSTTELAGRQFDAQKIGLNRYHLFPTLCWLDSSDRFLKIQCAAGTLLALLVLIGIAPAPCLFLLWLIYLSLISIGRDFLSFQWDNLLLETGFLAIFFAPLQLLPRLSRAPRPSRIALFLLRWLLFRLIFESGCVKLLSGDTAWRNLTALDVHFETQPLPTWVGWYAHQMPVWGHKLSTVLMFVIELGVPFLIFGPRRLRHWGAWALIGLQVFIFLTGNYCFFNLLTVALCVLLFDDAALKKCAPARWRNNPALDPSLSTLRRRPRWPIQVTSPLTAIVLVVSMMQLSGMFRVRVPWPQPLVALYEWLAPLRSVNQYGLFAVMTTTRPEIIVEGSDDGVNWLAYEFKYKPGNLKRRPGFVEPHQPRLDWQMWFAALGNFQQNPWFVEFCIRLLQGSPDVLALLERNPFPEKPPRYIRAVTYNYRFTNMDLRRKTGQWWRREPAGNYLPPLSLREDDSSPEK
jgi:predicted DCC family thiol-disulfide oxidoreductase YuxK